MSIDEMINILTFCPLENHGGVWMTKEQGQAIIAALRAGQQMRDELYGEYGPKFLSLGTDAWDQVISTRHTSGDHETSNAAQGKA